MKNNHFKHFKDDEQFMHIKNDTLGQFIVISDANVLYNVTSFL